MNRRTLLLFAAVGTVWGIPYFFIAIAGQSFSTVTLVWMRVVIGAIFLLPVAIKRGVLGGALKNWPWVLFFAVVEMVGPWYFITEAERHVPTSLVGLMMTTIPFISAAITGIFLGDKAAGHPVTIVGLVIGFSGVVSLIGIDAFSGHLELGPTLLLVLTSLCYAIAPIVVNRKIPSVSTLAVTAVSLAMVAIIYTPFAVVTLPIDLAAGPTVESWISIVILGVVCSALAFILYFALIREVGPRRSTLITYLNLLVAAVLGVLFLAEPITPGILVGLPLIVAGSYLAGRDREPYVRKGKRPVN
ncbi:MAG: DMT family transporter [Microbacteriaceae bacterium]